MSQTMERHSEQPGDVPRRCRWTSEASNTTVALDRTLKASLYAKAGVPDYWILNLVSGTLEVRRAPAESPGSPFGSDYSSVTILRRGEAISPLAAPHCAVSVDELLP